ncbi:type VI secretion system tip protein TssI/VgrG [Polyangium sp. 15x6]|uniref:type VI secretion system Vgr family protein n=1 Tax=Polyangium sp. 15x6 TaxID=3042687 RepID=UPI00249B090A|nr:type VI secretion system tip protein TssI/VgrG [Polyangium sp. 15x6]MDI3291660.1 type VI secretion system tip protein TssI/VgrG [Polyangium sp. 15x6]
MQFGLESLQSGIGALQTVGDLLEKLRALFGGAHPDFTFAREGGSWSELLVVRFTAREAISRPFRYDITLLHRAAPGSIDLDELLGARACLRIATLTAPGYRIVHGVVTEAVELTTVPDGMLYRVILEPPLALAERRTRSRVFLDKTLRQIIDATLAPYFTRSDGARGHGDDDHPDAYTPAEGRFCYRVTEPTRLDDPTARPYCVQYDESDFAFLSRILEDEGIAYHFEHGPGTCLVVLSDGDEGKTRLDPFAALGPGVAGRDVTAIHLGGRLRPKAVRLADFDWRKPSLAMRAEAGQHEKLYEHRYPGEFVDRPALGAPLARARLDRFATEAAYATGSGGVRVLSAGAVFKLDLDGSHHDGEYLATALELRAEQAGVVSQSSDSMHEPFSVSFELVRRGKGSRVAPSRFRPERVTPKPKVRGAQTAFVTDEPGARGAEVHVGGPQGAEIGCVRLRFAWDDDPERHVKEPTSCWVRVSHLFAGAGRGALFHPRVGDEVIVDFLDGDPDRPIVTGRVYNGANLPPADAKGAATVSALRSLATPGGGVMNEIAFNDTRGREQFALHAGRDMSTYAGNDRAETVTNNASSRVGVDRSENTGANRSTDVGGNNTEHVGGNESVAVDANQRTAIGASLSLAVGANRDASIAANDSTTIGGAQSLTVAASRSVNVGADEAHNIAGRVSESVGGNASHAVGGSSSMVVAGSDSQNVGGSRNVTIGGSLLEAIGAAIVRRVGASAASAVGADASLATGGSVNLTAGGSANICADASIGMQAPAISVSADGEITLAGGGSAIVIGPSGITLQGPSIAIGGGTVDVKAGLVKLN